MFTRALDMLIGPQRNAPPPPLPPTIIEDATCLDECLGNKNYRAIIQDKNLFWLAYCRAFSCEANAQDRVFSVSLKENQMRIVGAEEVIEPRKKIIEEIRQAFVERIEKKSNGEFCFLESNGQVYFFKVNQEKVIDCLEYQGFSQSNYKSQIKPILPILVELCGGIYHEEERKKMVLRHRTLAEETISVVRMDYENSLTYPIPPKTILSQEMHQALYPLYQAGQLCDFTIIARDEYMIRVHSLVLYAFGGPVFQSLVTSDMREGLEKTLSFREYSQKIVLAFADFIYLEGQSFIDKIIAENTLSMRDLSELFIFANLYQIDTLVDCCTNLMSLFATSEDVAIMQQLAEQHDNEHLRRLNEHLSPARAISLLKV